MLRWWSLIAGFQFILLADQAGSGDVALPQRHLLPIELGQQVEELGGLHALCFSLQVMQTRVHGMALSRAGAIASPQSRQMP